MYKMMWQFFEKTLMKKSRPPCGMKNYLKNFNTVGLSYSEFSQNPRRYVLSFSFFVFLLSTKKRIDKCGVEKGRESG
jgi:hypothetical protein